jgi:hypothetical protein
VWDLGNVVGALLVEGSVESFGFADCTVLMACTVWNANARVLTDLQLNIFELGLKNTELLEACHKHLLRLHLYFSHVGRSDGSKCFLRWNQSVQDYER